MSLSPRRLLHLLSLVIALAPAPASAVSLAWLPPVDVADGRGERGPWQQNASRFEYVDDPGVALDEQGDAYVAWVDQGRKAVFLRRYAPDGSPRTAAVDVSRHPGSFSWLPRTALGRAGDVYVLWQEIIFSGGSHGGDILFARSTDGGRTFDTPLNLTQRSLAGEGKGRITRESWHNGSLDVVAGDDGAVHAAWTAYEGELKVATSTDRGATFGPALHVAGSDEEPARAPALAVDANGGVYLAWTVGERASADVRLARSSDRGRSFGPARLVAVTPAYSDAPKLAVDRVGVLHVAFGDGDRVLYMRSADRGTTFATPADLSGAGAAFPHLALGDGATVLVAWERLPDPQRQPRGLGLAWSSDGGTRFAAAAVPESEDHGGAPNGGGQGLLMRKLAANGRGDVALVNSSLSDGERSRVWWLRGRLEAR